MVRLADTPPVPSVPPAPVECIRTHWVRLLQARDGEEGIHRLGGSVDPMHHVRLKQL